MLTFLIEYKKSQVEDNFQTSYVQCEYHMMLLDFINTPAHFHLIYSFGTPASFQSYFYCILG